MEEAKGFVSAKDALAVLEQYQGCFFPHSAAVKIINQLSREDVEPVVHGRWIKKAAYNDRVLNTVACSACDIFQPVGCWDYYNYCPHCGARMDLEVRE